MVRCIFATLLLTATISAWAHTPVDGDIWASGGPILYRPQSTSQNISAAHALGFGLLAEGDLSHNGGVEVGIFYLRPRFAIVRDGYSIIEESERVQVSMGYRHWFTRWVSVGLAFYSSYPVGDPDVVRNDYAPAPSPKTSARDLTEYGFDGSIQAEVWRNLQNALIIETRYAHSVTPKPDENANHFTAMLGFKYYVQGREKRIEPEE